MSDVLKTRSLFVGVSSDTVSQPLCFAQYIKSYVLCEVLGVESPFCEYQ